MGKVALVASSWERLKTSLKREGSIHSSNVPSAPSDRPGAEGLYVEELLSSLAPPSMQWPRSIKRNLGLWGQSLPGGESCLYSFQAVAWGGCSTSAQPYRQTPARSPWTRHMAQGGNFLSPTFYRPSTISKELGRTKLFLSGHSFSLYSLQPTGTHNSGRICCCLLKKGQEIKKNPKRKHARRLPAVVEQRPTNPLLKKTWNWTNWSKIIISGLWKSIKGNKLRSIIHEKGLKLPVRTESLWLSHQKLPSLLFFF